MVIFLPPFFISSTAIRNMTANSTDEGGCFSAVSNPRPCDIAKMSRFGPQAKGFVQELGLRLLMHILALDATDRHEQRKQLV